VDDLGISLRALRLHVDELRPCNYYI